MERRTPDKCTKTADECIPIISLVSPLITPVLVLSAKSFVRKKEYVEKVTASSSLSDITTKWDIEIVFLFNYNWNKYRVAPNS